MGEERPYIPRVGVWMGWVGVVRSIDCFVSLCVSPCGHCEWQCRQWRSVRFTPTPTNNTTGQETTTTQGHGAGRPNAETKGSQGTRWNGGGCCNVFRKGGIVCIRCRRTSVSKKSRIVPSLVRFYCSGFLLRPHAVINCRTKFFSRGEFLYRTTGSRSSVRRMS